jgi:hypothetical protein
VITQKAATLPLPQSNAYREQMAVHLSNIFDDAETQLTDNSE